MNEISEKINQIEEDDDENCRTKPCEMDSGLSSVNTLGLIWWLQKEKYKSMLQTVIPVIGVEKSDN